MPNLLQIGHDGDRQVPHFVETQRTKARCLDLRSINYRNQTNAFVCIIKLSNILKNILQTIVLHLYIEILEEMLDEKLTVIYLRL